LLEDPARASDMGMAGCRSVCEQYRLDQTVETYYERYSAAAARLRKRNRASREPARV
jgi:hypothetical protein